MLTAEQALAINRFIDSIHSQEMWSFPFALAMIFFCELFWPPKTKFTSRFDRYFSYARFGLVIVAAIVAVSQGVTGGCILHIPQNYLAKTYLGREYWNPYGLAFREYFPTWFEPWLRLSYFVGAVVIVWLTWLYYKKRIRVSDLESRKD